MTAQHRDAPVSPRLPAHRTAALTARHALIVLALMGGMTTTLTACASAPRRGERVGGLFDGPRGEPARSPSSDGYAAGEQTESEDRVSVVETGGQRTRGLFDFRATKKEAARESAPASAAAPPPPSPSPSPMEPDAEPPADKPAHVDEKMPEASGPRLVIYKGNLTVMVTVVEASVQKLSARAKELGGYVENQASNGGANNATVTMRIPAEKFYDLVNELGSYGQVTQKQISAEDVTKRVFDVELRLDTAERARARLLDLLKQATKMEEILQIENEVRRLTDEIEGMKGELRFLKDQVSLSTLSVSFYSSAPAPTAGPTRTRSRFDWINAVGIEPVLNNF